jgi:S1-C subfamily serine protease
VQNLTGNHPFDGARVSNILPSVAEEMGLDETEGVVVVSTRPGTVAARIFQPGDIILEVQSIKIDTVADLEGAIAKRQRIWQLSFSRGGKVLNLQLQG